MILRNQNKKRCEGDGERIRGGFWILQLLWAWGAVYGVSRMKEQLGLTDMLLLHKSLLSLFLFATYGGGLEGKPLSGVFGAASLSNALFYRAFGNGTAFHGNR